MRAEDDFPGQTTRGGFICSIAPMRRRIDGEGDTGVGESTPCAFSVLNPGSRAKALPGTYRFFFFWRDVDLAPQMAKDRGNVVKLARKLDNERQITIRATIWPDKVAAEARARKKPDT